MKTKTCLFLAFLCFSAVGPKAKAVSPPPDGCYPGYTTAEGCNTLQSLTIGIGNTGIGSYSLFANSIGNYNTATGAGALALNNADGNTAIGATALLLNTTGRFNTATGAYALQSNTTADGNTANGVGALQLNTTGIANVAMGFSALQHNSTGASNTANGYLALSSNTIGFDNTAVGEGALGFTTTGNSNTAVGGGALGNNPTGIQNTALGAGAGSNVTFASNVICIGTNVPGSNVSDSCFIDNIRDIQTQNGDAIPVVIDSAKQLGTASSSRRFKKEIKPMDKSSEAILALKPVTFQYKSDAKGITQFGLIAEEVADVNPKSRRAKH